MNNINLTEIYKLELFNNILLFYMLEGLYSTQNAKSIYNEAKKYTEDFFKEKDKKETMSY